MLGPVVVSVTGTSSSFISSASWVQLDYMKSGYVTVQSVVTTSGAAAQTYNVEYSLDALSSITNWFSTGSSANSSHSFYAFAFPIRCLRLNVTSGTSNTVITTTVIQSAN